MTTLLVTGGRYFADVPAMWVVLDNYAAGLPEPGVQLLVEGASDDVTGPYKGADYWARQWAKAHGIECISVHAKWSASGKAAGPLRNSHMLREFKPDCVIAFNGGRGTADMLSKAKAAGVPTTEVSCIPTPPTPEAAKP